VRFDEAHGMLAAALAHPLPGLAAQRRLAPVPPREWPPGTTPTHVRNAAGLLLLFPVESLAHLVLTVRADTLGRHGGQVSLPGGVVEPGETFEHAALREASEEVGLVAAEVQTLGSLTPVDIPVSGFRLHPIVGTIGARPDLAPSDGEVARILEIPVGELMDPARFEWRTLERDGRMFRVPTLVVQGAEVWGATAMVVAEFLTLLGWSGPPAERSDL
jgi:8-oxo-dGTP pyrophosphatase MutT (NUDIX family)